MSDIEDLHKLADLKDRNIISQKEFDKKKSDILNGRTRSDATGNPSRTKRGGLWWKIPVGIVALIVIANLAGNDGSKATASSPTTTTISTQISATASETLPSPYERMKAITPRDQGALVMAVEAARQQFAAGANDMAKGAARPDRARRLCSAFPSRAVTGWIGQVKSLSTNGDGKGVLELEIGPDIQVKTWNNSLSDILDHTLIDPSSNLFMTATRLREGQLTRFSGKFFSSPADCLEESSVSLSGSIRDPEFVFLFQSLEPL